jgi:hypothetical protein
MLLWDRPTYIQYRLILDEFFYLTYHLSEACVSKFLYACVGDKTSRLLNEYISNGAIEHNGKLVITGIWCNLLPSELYVMRLLRKNARQVDSMQRHVNAADVTHRLHQRLCGIHHEGAGVRPVLS